jgi:hypothetical protein
MEILRLYYDDPLIGHFGIDKTMDLIRRYFYWENIESDVREYV